MSDNGRPRIYVASLSDYNAGRLHGTWIDATADLETIWQQINEMLSESVEAPAEEFAIHDYDNFGPVRLGEYEQIEVVARLATGIHEHGDAFAHWAAQLDRAEWEQLDQFEDRYIGHWESRTNFGEEFLSDFGYDLDDLLPEFIAPYVRVDVEALVDDLSADYLMLDDGHGGIYVFTGA